MNKYMNVAIKEAKKAYKNEEVPIGAVIVRDNKIISKAYNLRETKQSVISHAEILAIEKACRKLKTWRLENCTMYVTLEPCYMCFGAIIQARIKKIVYIAKNPKFGAVNKFNLNKINGFNKLIIEKEKDEEEIIKLMLKFFKEKRKM